MSLARDTGHRGSIPGRYRPFLDGWQPYNEHMDGWMENAFPCFVIVARYYWCGISVSASARPSRCDINYIYRRACALSRHKWQCNRRSVTYKWFWSFAFSRKLTQNYFPAKSNCIIRRANLILSSPVRLGAAHRLTAAVSAHRLFSLRVWHSATRGRLRRGDARTSQATGAWQWRHSDDTPTPRWRQWTYSRITLAKIKLYSVRSRSARTLHVSIKTRQLWQAGVSIKHGLILMANSISTLSTADADKPARRV